MKPAGQDEADEIQTMHPHHTEPELVIMAVNRLWIDLIEAGREEPSMEDWRRTRAAMGINRAPERTSNGPPSGFLRLRSSAGPVLEPVDLGRTSARLVSTVYRLTPIANPHHEDA